jgi:Fic family protein
MDPEAFRNGRSGRTVQVPGKGYWTYLPEPLPPRLEWPSTLVTGLADAASALGELKGLGHSLANPHLLIAPFIRREAVLSSRIEGTQASLSDLYAYEAVQLSMFSRPTDVREVHNYVRALEYGLQRLETLPLSLRLIRELHARLMEGVRGEHRTPGEFRRSQNWIGPPGCLLDDATFVPPPPEEMRAALYDLENYMRAEATLHPLIRLGLIHYQFEAIHPFLDGNGRVGRLLIVLLLCAWDLLPQPLLYLSAYFQRHRETYYQCLLAVSQRDAWTEWLLFFLQGVVTQSKDAVARSRRLLDLRERYRVQFQSQRTAARLLQVIDVLFTRPVTTINQLAEALDVSHQSATRYVRTLESEGIMREITGQARNRVYQADAILEAIVTPLSGQDGERA